MQKSLVHFDSSFILQFVTASSKRLLFPLSLSMCMNVSLPHSCCKACSDLFVKASAVKATLVGPLSCSLWLSDCPLREPRGGCHYTLSQRARHNRLALSIVWAQAWSWHQHLIQPPPPLPSSTPPVPPFMFMSPPCVLTQTDPMQCQTGVSPVRLGEL